MTELSIKDRVAAGAEWLDANRPGWVGDINLDELALDDCTLCVLGQLYGDFFEAPQVVVVSNQVAASYGFDRPSGIAELSVIRRYYDDLNAEWRRVITARRQVPDGGGSG